MTRALLVSAFFVLAGCGRTEPIPPVRVTFEPNATGDGGVFCRSACPGPPPGLRTPLLTVSGGVILHWPICEGCLRLTVDRSSSSGSGALLQAVKSAGHDWDITLAGGLCFEDAVEDDPMPEDARQRVHVRLSTQGGSVTHRFEVATGVIRNADVTVRDWTELPTLLGRALGLDKSDDAANSIMSWPNTNRTTPGEFDQTSLRQLYGPPRLWCQ